MYIFLLAIYFFVFINDFLRFFISQKSCEINEIKEKIRIRKSIFCKIRSYSVEGRAL